VDALALGAVGLDESLAVAGQVPQLADDRRGHEAAAEQPTLQQLAQPGRITDIGLAAGQELDVAGVDQQQLQPPLLQHIPDGLPILAGRLQHDLRDVVVLEPLGEGLQTGAERRVGVHLLAAPAGAIGHANTGHDLILADIQSGAAFVDHLHRRHLLVGLVRRPAGPTDQATLKDVLVATVRGAGTAPASVLSTGSVAPRRAELGRATRFSSLVAAPGHGGLISNHALTAVRSGVSPGRCRPSGAK
jgi:hypothetical protein